MKNLLASLFVITTSLISTHAHAQETTNRCLLLGPLAISSYIATLEQVARSNRAEGARQSANAANVIGLYERLGCPQKALITAIECLSTHVVKPTEKKKISAIAQRCMKQAGMPTR
ncbi:MAG: hypothetical protein GKS01_10635 [Alphaproteobacteria bacterium]|nr:hypothetical protein [Alphaproteobacteria bacterium]